MAVLSARGQICALAERTAGPAAPRSNVSGASAAYCSSVIVKRPVVLSYVAPVAATYAVYVSVGR
jgi:hypothetical protein